MSRSRQTWFGMRIAGLATIFMIAFLYEGGAVSVDCSECPDPAYRQCIGDLETCGEQQGEDCSDWPEVHPPECQACAYEVHCADECTNEEALVECRQVGPA